MIETLRNNREQAPPEGLWLPGMHLDEEYHTPDDAELETLWEAYNPDGTAEACTDVYGVFTRRDGIRAVASVDLCEVVRDTVLGLDEATGVYPKRRSTYGTGTWYREDVSDPNYQESVIVSAIRALMGKGLVRPVEHIDAIATMLRNWRAQGVYVVANTSTLPGCERGTIQHTLAEYLPGCFDALVLPRNHTGTGSMTKARALEAITTQAGIPLLDMPFVHIDDALRHVNSFRAQYGRHADIGLFVPLHADNKTTEPGVNQPSPSMVEQMEWNLSAAC